MKTITVESNFNEDIKYPSPRLTLVKLVLKETKRPESFITDPFTSNRCHHPLIMCCKVLHDGEIHNGDIANYFGLTETQVIKYLNRHSQLMTFDTDYRLQLAKVLSRINFNKS